MRRHSTRCLQNGAFRYMKIGSLEASGSSLRIAVSLSLFPLSWTSFEFSGEVQVWFPKREVLFSHVTSKYSWKVLLNQLSIPSRLANVLVEY